MEERGILVKEGTLVDARIARLHARRRHQHARPRRRRPCTDRGSCRTASRARARPESRRGSRPTACRSRSRRGPGRPRGPCPRSTPGVRCRAVPASRTSRCGRAPHRPWRKGSCSVRVSTTGRALRPVCRMDQRYRSSSRVYLAGLRPAPPTHRRKRQKPVYSCVYPGFFRCFGSVQRLASQAECRRFDSGRPL
jgi:hypothetical protein